ncbi:hypothetical protein SMC26_10500 [Actinomadura fulvescens]|uniref:Uncharacterized protein n=1 Tax=Actinomadura fulvescens TaxID=46160 RepID=A0ABP6CB78_9ACTN
MPRWAFLGTSCLKGNPYPPASKDGHGRVRNLWGKASHGWRHVSFATANLFRTGKFKITNRCTGPSGWIYGLDLQARRWGWVKSSALRGNPCHK